MPFWESEVLVQDQQKMVMVKQEMNDSAANVQFRRAAASSDADQHLQLGNQQQGVKYVCQQCQKVFSTEGTLKRHLKEAHTNVVFSCKHCSTRVKLERSMKRHYQAKHPDTIVNGIYDYEKLE